MSELPAGWVAALVSEVADVIAGQAPPGASYNKTGDGLPFYQGKTDFGDMHLGPPRLWTTNPSKCARANDVLLSVRAPVGPTNLATGDCAIGRGLAAIRSRHGISHAYLLYAIRATARCLEEQATGTTFSAISSPVVRGHSLPIAPTAEQERIVAVIEEQFSQLDAGVTALGQVRQNIKRMRAAVLGAAVSGRLVPQDPTEGSGADILASIHVEPRRAKRKGTKFVSRPPIVPSRWATAPWAAIGHSQNGRAFPSADYTTKGRRLLRPGNLHLSGDVVWETANTKRLPERYAIEFPDYLVGENEIVMNLTAQSLRDEFLGRVCMTGPGEAALLNQRIARLTPVGMNVRFVFLVLKSPLFRRFVSRLNTGSLIQHMFTWQVDQFIFPIPPRREQDRIVASVEQSFSILDALDHLAVHAQTRAHRLRSAILAAAFSGKLTPQDPNDEPASSLLERITAAQASSNGNRPTKGSRQRGRKAAA